jgi:hypothetical protein
MALADWFADADTAYLGASLGEPSNFTALADDLSANNDDVANVSADHADESPHAGTSGLLGDLCLEALVWLSDAGDGYVLFKGSSTLQPGWSIFFRGSDDEIECYRTASSSRFNGPQLVPPSISSTPQRYWIAWSDAHNPATTGASDARRSTLRIWRIVDDELVEYAEATNTHVLCDHDPGQFVIGAASQFGGEAWDPHTIELVRVSSRPRGRKEIETYIPKVLAEIEQQGCVWAAKQGHRFLGLRSHDQSFDVLAADRSQYATDMTADTSWIYETSAPRFDFNAPRTIAVVVEHDADSDSGTVYGHTSDENQFLIFSDTDEITIVHNSSVVHSTTIGFLSGSTDVHRLVVAWVTIENPDATSGSDALLSFLLVADADGGVHRSTFTHEIDAGNSTTNVFGAQDVAGTDPYTGELLTASFSAGQQSLTELALDFGLIEPDALTTNTKAEDRPPIPVVESSGVGDEGEFYGVQPGWVARQTASMVRRLWSPLWNERLRNVDTWQQADWANHPFVADAPNTTQGHFLMLGWYAPAPVPPGASSAWVRVHLLSEPISGDSVPLGVRVYSCNKPPVLSVGQVVLQGADAAESFDARYVEAVVDRDDGGTVGSYVAVGLLPLAVGKSGVRAGMTYLAVAIAVDPNNESANDANASWQVAAIHIVPTNAEVEGGLPQGQIGIGGD